MTKREKKMCNSCKKEKQLYDFYGSQSILFSDGKVPVCKKCLKEMIDEHNLESVKNTLQMIDKPFIAKVWASSEESETDTVGTYFRMINSLHQYKDYTWTDSQFDGEKNTNIYQHRFDNIDEVEEIKTDGGTISLTKEVAMKFGSGYTNREYLQMEKFYNDMTMTHDINTPQLKKQLVYLCKLQIQMDRALESGDSSAFKKYNDSYENILKSSALAPKDRRNLDEATGLRNFSTIFAEVERRGYVKPKPIEEVNDIVDKSLVAYINHVRKMIGVENISELPKDVKKDLE